MLFHLLLEMILNIVIGGISRVLNYRGLKMGPFKSWVASPEVLAYPVKTHVTLNRGDLPGSLIV